MVQPDRPQMTIQ